MNIYTIGFTNRSAREFFGMLQRSGARLVADVRFDDQAPSAGFARGNDLRYFLESLCDMAYIHVPVLAPTRPMLKSYLEDGWEWSAYERAFIDLLAERRVETLVDPDSLDDAVLLCSEKLPDRCHRRLVAEYLQGHWEGVAVHHLT